LIFHFRIQLRAQLLMVHRYISNQNRIYNNNKSRKQNKLTSRTQPTSKTNIYIYTITNNRNYFQYINDFTSSCVFLHIGTHHTAMTKPASCLDPIRLNVEPSSSVLSIISSHHCPAELPSSPTYMLERNRG